MKQIFKTENPGECKLYLEWERPTPNPWWVQLNFPFASDHYSFSLTQAIRESLKMNVPYYRTTHRVWPSGTVRGIATLAMSPSVAGSLLPLEAPPYIVLPKEYGLLPGFSRQVLWDATSHRTAAGYLELYIEGVVYGIWSWHVIPEPTAPDDMNQADISWILDSSLMGVPKIMWFAGDSPPKYHVGQLWFIRVGSNLSSTPEPLPTPPLHWHLYHGTKISAEITPPHGTVLFDGSYQTIEAYPLNDRTLTSFEVQDVEQLPGAVNTVVLDPRITITPTPTPDPAGLARMVYGPVHSDVYVDAIAIGVTIDETLTAGVTKTFQMTTTDCYVTDDSWSLGATDLPVGVTKSISTTGLVSILIPEDVYEGNPSATYYLEVIFTGYSQTKTLRLIFTVDAVPAFGTVWTAVTKLSEPIKDILYASNGSIIIVTTSKVFVTTDLDTFTELTPSGTFTTPFYAAAEISGGRIIVADKASIWVHVLGEVGITRQNYSAVTNGAGNSVQLVGNLASNEVCYVAANSAGVYYRAIVWNVTTGTLVGSSMPLGDQTEIAASACTKPILANDGSWVFAQALAGGYSLARYSGGAMTQVKPLEASYGNTAPVMWKEANGRIFVMGIDAVTPNRHFVRYSDDHGVTWTDEAIIGADGNSTLYAAAGLKTAYAIFSQVGAVKRSTDSMLTFTTPQTLDGTIAAFAMIGDRKLLAGTNGATTNLYKSEA